MSWITAVPGGSILSARVIPRASRNAIGEEMPDALKLRLQAPPVEGKANKALVEFLAETLDLPRRDIEVLKGETSRNKKILIRGLTPAQVRQRLLGD